MPSVACSDDGGARGGCAARCVQAWIRRRPSSLVIYAMHSHKSVDISVSCPPCTMRVMSDGSSSALASSGKSTATRLQVTTDYRYCMHTGYLTNHMSHKSHVTSSSSIIRGDVWFSVPREGCHQADPPPPDDGECTSISESVNVCPSIHGSDGSELPKQF